MKRTTAALMSRELRRLAAQSLACVTLLVFAMPAHAASTGPIVYVEGVPLTYDQVTALTAYAFAAGALQPVPKPASAMPAQTPYAVYAGKNAVGRPAVWVRADAQHAKLADAAKREQYEETLSAGVVSVLDGATQMTQAKLMPDPRLVALAVKARGNVVALAALQYAIQHAMSDMSVAIAKDSMTKREWMFAHLPEGMPKAQALALLQAHGISAKPGSATTEIATFPWRFEPGCYFTSSVTITFDKSNRIYKLSLDDNHPDCL